MQNAQNPINLPKDAHTFNCFLGTDNAGLPTVGIILSPDSVVMTPEGTPYPGCGLDPSTARALAFQMLANAELADIARKRAPAQ